jgi:hypothetical protein
MALRTGIKVMSALFILFPISTGALPKGFSPTVAVAQEVRQGNTEIGILDNRLTGSHLRLWQSIRDVVFARSKSGQLKHPKLHTLWRAAEDSGHVIRIELSDRESFRAGQFHIESIEAGNERFISVIELNLYAIKGASVSKSARREDGLVPFAGLGTKERCAEVLGHELAHAVTAFHDEGYFQIYREIERLRGELQYGPQGLIQSGPDINERIRILLQLIREIEKPAEAAEIEIWRELHAGRP